MCAGGEQHPPTGGSRTDESSRGRRTGGRVKGGKRARGGRGADKGARKEDEGKAGLFVCECLRSVVRSPGRWLLCSVSRLVSVYIEKSVVRVRVIFTLDLVPDLNYGSTLLVF